MEKIDAFSTQTDEVETKVKKARTRATTKKTAESTAVSAEAEVSPTKRGRKLKVAVETDEVPKTTVKRGRKLKVTEESNAPVLPQTTIFDDENDSIEDDTQKITDTTSEESSVSGIKSELVNKADSGIVRSAEYKSNYRAFFQLKEENATLKAAYEDNINKLATDIRKQMPSMRITLTTVKQMWEKRQFMDLTIGQLIDLGQLWGCAQLQSVKVPVVSADEYKWLTDDKPLFYTFSSVSRHYVVNARGLMPFRDYDEEIANRIYKLAELGLIEIKYNYNDTDLMYAELVLSNEGQFITTVLTGEEEDVDSLVYEQMLHAIQSKKPFGLKERFVDKDTVKYATQKLLNCTCSELVDCINEKSVIEVDCISTLSLAIVYSCYLNEKKLPDSLAELRNVLKEIDTANLMDLPVTQIWLYSALQSIVCNFNEDKYKEACGVTEQSSDLSDEYTGNEDDMNDRMWRFW